MYVSTPSTTIQIEWTCFFSIIMLSYQVQLNIEQSITPKDNKLSILTSLFVMCVSVCVRVCLLCVCFLSYTAVPPEHRLPQGSLNRYDVQLYVPVVNLC